MTADPAREARTLRRAARQMLWVALVGLLLPALATLVAGLYQELVHPTDMHLPGLSAAALIFYLAPVGLVFLVLGLSAGAWARWLDRKGSRRRAD